MVVVGSVSVDRIRTPDRFEYRTVGGAGLYAALGAAATGLPVAMVGVRSDHPLVEAITWPDHVDHRALRYVPGCGLRFDISYDQDWRATYLIDGASAEAAIIFEAMPARFTGAEVFHLCPTGSVFTQLLFANYLRTDPRTENAFVAATTFRGRITASPTAIERLWRLADVFICNAEEAVLVTCRRTLDDALTAISTQVRGRARPGVTVVTDGGSGCWVITPEVRRHVPAYPSRVVDPTGAGESFAGAFAAARLAGADWFEAARIGSAVASLVVAQVGPHALLATGVGQTARRRVEQVRFLPSRAGR